MYLSYAGLFLMCFTMGAGASMAAHFTVDPIKQMYCLVVAVAYLPLTLMIGWEGFMEFKRTLTAK